MLYVVVSLEGEQKNIWVEMLVDLGSYRLQFIYDGENGLLVIKILQSTR